MNRFEKLFTPFTIKGTTIRNRIVMPPMKTNLANANGYISERFINYYVERGKGGTGLLIIEPASFSYAGRRRARSLLLSEDRFIPKLQEFTAAVHATGAKVLQQINHVGRLLVSPKDQKSSVPDGVGPVGPSAIPHLATGVIPKALTVAEIIDLIEKFSQVALRVKEAGYDGVEIHGAHGLLVNQFYSRYSNRRIDEYGGNLENRMRFPLEVYRRIREVTGDNFLISFRVNAREYAPVETPLEDVIALCQRLEEEGVDLIHMTVANSETTSNLLKMMPFGSEPLGCYADLASSIKSKLNVPFIAVGRINTPEIAEKMLRDGSADFVATGRALIADPHWPEKALKGQTESIRRCIGCNQGCIERLIQEKEVTCLYNPEAGREGGLTVSPERKKVWVIGGGPGGMEAAIIAVSRGHAAELFEKAGELGGQSILASVPPGKEEFSLVKSFLMNELARFNVPIHLNEEVTEGMIMKALPDVVIFATGALPLIPEIPGIKGDNVMTAWDVLKGREVGNNVVVAGGGSVGVETALFLYRKGANVILIEALDEIVQDAGTLNRIHLKEGLAGTTVDVRCKTELLKIDASGVTVRSDVGTYDIKADTVVLALGAKAHGSFLDKITGKVREAYAIGDCVSPRKMIEAIHEAYEIASTI